MIVQYKPIDFLNKISQNNFSYTGSYTRKITETNTDVEKLQDKAKTFQKNVKILKKYTSGGISRDLLGTQLEDFVKSYNNLKNSAGSVTDADVQKQITKLEKLFSDNEKSLKKIGIENVNGKYTFDSDTFEEAPDKYINAVLIGHDSFIGQADKIMRKVEETADNAHYNIAEHKLSRTLNYQAADLDLAASYITLAGQTIPSIKTYNDVVQSGNTSDSTVQDSVKKLLKYFANSVYQADTTKESDNINKLNQLCLDNKEKLAKLGLTFDGEQKNMQFDENTDITTNEFKSAYNELFGSNALFGNTVSEYCKNTYNDIVQPDKLGISILDEFV